MKNIAIIDIDEYLKLKKEVESIDLFKSLCVIDREDWCITNPFGERPYSKTKITITKKNLDKVINDIFGTNNFEVNIIDEEKNESDK